MPSPTGFRPVGQHAPVSQISPDAEARLEEFCSRTGYKILQENGQRKYGGPPANWSGPAPTRGCEVFVGKLPRDLFEDELIPLFSQAGEIFELRLMMDFSGSNRGYCFLTFGKKEEAKRACQDFNNCEIRHGKHIGVMMSVDNCRLFVGGIPRDRKRDEIKGEMEKLTEGVVDVILYPSANDKTKNRGFAFVEYASHKAAAMARRNLVPKHVQLWGQPICVDWAEPEQDVDEETMANVKILYVRNLMLDTSEEAIRKFFEAIKEGSVERVKKLKDYAFVHFFEREDAHNAMQQTNGAELEGAVLEVVWAKPPDKSIMRYVKSVQKLGNQALPPGPSIHQNIVAAAAAEMYAASSNRGMMTPSGRGSPPSPSSVGMDHISWAYTGYPFIDNGYSYNVAQHNERYQQTRQSGGRNYRGAAGWRAAGFQAFVTNQVRKNRRRHTDAALVYDLSPLVGTGGVQYPVHPILPTHPGMVLIPTASLLSPQLMSTPQQMSPIVPTVVSQAPAPAIQQQPTPMVTTPPGGSPPAPAPPRLYSELLEEACKSRDWGGPHFEITPFNTKDPFGREIHAYLSKVTIPSLGTFCPPRYWTESGEAREFCALFALTQMGFQTEAPLDLSALSPIFPPFPQSPF